MIDTLLPAFAVLATAALFGGMVLYSFGFAPLVFTKLEVRVASRLLREAFPWFYLFTIAFAALATLAAIAIDSLAAWLLGIVTVLGVAARQGLMPAINRASDAGAPGKPRFRRLHGLSVAINMLQLVLIAIALLRLS